MTEVDALRERLGITIKERDSAEEKLKNIKAALEIAQGFACYCPTCIIVKAAANLLAMRVPSV